MEWLLFIPFALLIAAVDDQRRKRIRAEAEARGTQTLAALWKERAEAAGWKRPNE